MKSKQIFFVITVALFFLTAIFSIFFSSPRYKSIVGEYKDIDKLGSHFIHSGIEAYKIGISADGMPIFVNPNMAYTQALEDFAEGFKQLQNEFNLRPVTKRDFESYKNLGWQTLSEDESIELQCHEITCFFGFFEDSMKANPVNTFLFPNKNISPTAFDFTAGDISWGK